MRVLTSWLTRSVLVSGLLAGGWALDGPALKPAPRGTKPMFPVQTRLELLNSPLPGEVARVLVSITAWAPGEDVAWKLTLPEGLTLVGGPDAWSGRLARGETRSFEVAVLVPDGAPYELYAAARLPERSNATGGAGLTLDLGGVTGPAATMQLVTSDGETYIQDRGEVKTRAEDGR
jgi:hypothetical protein